ncbi:MAG: glycosyltransferase family 39 protein, partial [Anaerolineae bacterium]|nr:glycosyltransferase family 39 protein [Anaerolineae bacterium]
MGSLRIWLLLLLFALAVLLGQYSTPVMEGMDEPVHYNYVEYLRAENHLPDRTTYLTNSTRQASGQPPLVYWLTGLPLRLLNPAFEDGQALLDNLYHVVRNHWVVPNMDTSNRRDNLNLYYHGRDEQAFENPLVVYKVHIMRLVSLALAVIAVAGAYAASREVFPNSAWALVSTALFAFTPTMIEAGSTVTNDIGAICFGTLAIWQTLRLLRRGDKPLTLILMGIFAALAGLSKINGLLVVPGMLIAILFANRSRSQSFKQLIINGVLFAIPLLILFAPWVIWGALQYHDPIGINTYEHGDPRYYFATLRPLSEVVKLLPDFYMT